MDLDLSFLSTKFLRREVANKFFVFLSLSKNKLILKNNGKRNFLINELILSFFLK